MANFVSVLIPLLLFVFLLRLLVMPIGWLWKLFLNSGCGFACLWLLNSVSGFTGLYFPINSVTALIAGFLGLPGIGLLALLQTVL